MKKHLFHIALITITVALFVLSFFFKDSAEAMVAIVDSQVTAISYQKAVIVKAIHVQPGQKVQAGDLLLEVVRPDLELDIQKLQTEIDQIDLEINARKQDNQFRNELAALELEGKRDELKAEIEKLRYQIEISKQRRSDLDRISNSGSIRVDTTDQILLEALKTQLKNLELLNQKATISRNAQLEKEVSVLNQQKRLVEQELKNLSAEITGLVRYAKFGGTIGNVNVQLDELVPPYETLLSIYESNPSLIKAFMNERVTYMVRPGDRMWVESENRLYKVEGVVLEIGARITDYPSKIDPDPMRQSYGQEVFVRISPDNRFLNGEKVYVYPTE